MAEMTPTSDFSALRLGSRSEHLGYSIPHLPDNVLRSLRSTRGEQLREPNMFSVIDREVILRLPRISA